MGPAAEMLTVIAVTARIFLWSGVDLDRQQVYCLTENIYHEARGEPIVGQIAVANVTKNRVKRQRWPNDYCGVVRQRNQFSWTAMAPEVADAKAWEIAAEIAGLVIADLIADNTVGATHYFNPTKADPSWKTRLAFVGDLGNHRFWRRDK